MKKKIKKAFTLVELLVVIAILAILATVSIVGYNSFTKKAKVSNDTALVSQLNTLLKADSMVNGDAKTPTDALKITSEAGYDVEKLTPTASNYDIIWNQKTNQFALLDEKGTAVYGEKSTEEYKNWKFVSEYNTATDYSVYLKGTTFTGDLEVKAGIDVGNNTGISSITYTNTTNPQDVRIVTNGGTLIVDAEKDTIMHYGSIDKVAITAIAKDSYHEHGIVKGNIEVTKGRVALEKGAKVSTILVNSKVANDVKVDVVTGASVGSVAPTTEVAKSDINASSTIPTEAKVVEIVDTSKTSLFEGGLGTEKSPYLVLSVDQLKNIDKLAETKNIHVELANEINVPFDKLSKIQWTGFNWFTYCVIKNFDGTFNGNGYKVTLPDATYFNDDTSAKYSTLIYNSNNVEVKNLVLNQGTLLCNAYSATVENIVTKGNMSFENNSGMIIGNAFNKATLINCKNEANINSTSYSAVFVGYAVNNLTLSFTNCFNAGTYIGVYSSLFLGNIPSSNINVTMNIVNCGNTKEGIVRSTSMNSSYKWNSYISYGNVANSNITLNGEKISIDRVISSGFVHGPNDTLAISRNDDNTFNITKSNIESVSYYEVKVAIYSRSNGDGGGTQMFSVEEKISATSDLNKTTIKYLSFTMENLEKTNEICGWSTGVKNGIEYYIFEKDGYTISNGTKPIVIVIAYDNENNVLSSASFTN